ncbi:MAG: DUF4097 family beta strand repeat-containing protein, partial [Candidatus Methanofastidiosia archaeon]
EKMSVRDKLEMERLQSLLEDLERMYKEKEIGEETYREMRRSYQRRIKSLQEKIMDFEFEIDKSTKEEIKEIKFQIKENVNEILKNTMQAIKYELKHKEYYNTKFNQSETLTENLEKADSLTLKCMVENGKVNIKGISSNTLTIDISKRVRGKDEEDANENFKDINLRYKARWKDKNLIVELKPEGPRGFQIELDINIPKKIDTTAVVSMENGKIRIKNINGKEITLATEHGGIDVKDVSYKDMNIEVENGSISLQGVTIKEDAKIENENGCIKLMEVEGKTLCATTEKGSITAYCTFNRGKIATELGSIKFKPQITKEQEYELKSELGSIKIFIENKKEPCLIEAEVEKGSIKDSLGLNRKIVDNVHIFESASYQNSDNQVRIKASTELGSIKIISN